MYEPHEINISYKYLKTVVSRLEEPICLIGGWAVYHNVNKNFKKATGRDYIGSIEKSFGRNLWLPKPHVLLATKLNSVIGRDKEHKRLKDISDIFALLWFSDVEILDIKSNLLEFYDKGNIKKIIGSISKQEIMNVASIIGFSWGEVERILIEMTR